MFEQCCAVGVSITHVLQETITTLNIVVKCHFDCSVSVSNIEYPIINKQFSHYIREAEGNVDIYYTRQFYQFSSD